MSTSATIQCPLCHEAVDKLLYHYHLDNERLVIEAIKGHHPTWTENDGICGRCLDYYHTEIVIRQRILPEIGPYFPVKTVDDFIILPTGVRMDTDSRYTGRGVTICFVDSGFYLHPDLTTHVDRIQGVIDITDETRDKTYFMRPHDESWHGTMTSVVCAGDGYAAKGLYKGIANAASLVLLKVQSDDGRIKQENLIKALEWILENHVKHNIRIVNISLGDDESVSYKKSRIDQLAEQLIEAGVVVVAAAGNNENGKINAPANSPNVITIGGLDDHNTLDNAHDIYHSSFGKTRDEVMKPELLAPAIWIAAPILPGTSQKTEAEVLHYLMELPEYDLKKELLSKLSQTKLEASICDANDTSAIRQSIIQRIGEAKYISHSYMHVDGTSFAAPIVSSVVAQMIEANPSLSPGAIREILFSTAKRLSNIPVERQGYGVIQPRKAIIKALRTEMPVKTYPSPYVNHNGNTIEFSIRHDCAEQVSLAGTFNYWARNVYLMEAGKNGLWKIEIPMPPVGRYFYKFLVDDRMWIEDTGNPYREPDGFNGFNSILVVDKKDFMP